MKQKHTYGIVKEFCYFFRRLIFKNRIGEWVITNMAKSSFTYNLSRKLIVPKVNYNSNSLRNVVRNNCFLRLNLSYEVDHFVYFRYKDTTFNSLHNEISNASVILDIGGNIGIFSLFFEKLNKKAIIHSFEPYPQTFLRLKEHLAINSSKVISHNFGLGEEQGEYKMYEVDVHNPGMNRILNGEQEYTYSIVKIETLDEFWTKKYKEQIDFIKIDVEGYELSVLKGGYNTLATYFPVLVIELDDNNLRNNGCTANEVIELLLRIGYNYIKTSDKMREILPTDDFSNCHIDIVAKKL